MGEVREIWICNRPTHTHIHTCTHICFFTSFHVTRAIFLLSGQLEKGLLFEYITLFAVSRIHIRIYAALINLAVRSNTKCATRSRDVWEVRRVIILCSNIVRSWVISTNYYTIVLTIESVNTSTAPPLSSKPDTISHVYDASTTFFKNFAKIYPLITWKLTHSFD